MPMRSVTAQCHQGSVTHWAGASTRQSRPPTERGRPALWRRHHGPLPSRPPAEASGQGSLRGGFAGPSAWRTTLRLAQHLRKAPAERPGNQSPLCWLCRAPLTTNIAGDKSLCPRSLHAHRPRVTLFHFPPPCGMREPCTSWRRLEASARSPAARIQARTQPPLAAPHPTPLWGPSLLPRRTRPAWRGRGPWGCCTCRLE